MEKNHERSKPYGSVGVWLGMLVGLYLLPVVLVLGEEWLFGTVYVDQYLGDIFATHSLELIVSLLYWPVRWILGW